MNRLAEVIVAVFTYNHEKYIHECLKSILEQSGDFTLKVIIFDDASTDHTDKVVRRFLNDAIFPPHIKFEYRRNDENKGMVQNFQHIIRSCEKLEGDYFTIIEGDDYWLPNRIQKHILFMKEHPEVKVSFNSFKILNQQTYLSSCWEVQQELCGQFFTADQLAKENFIGNLGCSFLRLEDLKRVPNKLFENFCSDWFFHIWIAQFGLIGHLSEVLSVYRKHDSSIWNGKPQEKQCEILFHAINDFNRLTNYLYDKGFQDYLMRLYRASMFDRIDLMIIDDVFPCRLSPFRFEEFGSYLDEIPNIRIFCNGSSLHIVTQRSNTEIITEYKRKNPAQSDKIIRWDDFRFSADIHAKLAYFCFLGNVFNNLEAVEKNHIPFVFELYPGGLFALNNRESDTKMCAIFSSPYFRKVIVTQKIVYDYLVDNGFCSSDQIISVFGVVTPKEKLCVEDKNIRHYGINKSFLDICFVAFRYTKYGEDKGYDLFVAAALQLARKYDNIRFHVVGGFDASVLDVSELGDKITFYGKQQPGWFEEFYQQQDLILSPNLNGKLSDGAFDGFPTASCTEAAVHETAIFCTDPLELNDNHFIDQKEIVLVAHDVKDIVEKIAYYHDHPEELKQLAVRGKAKVCQLYSYENQMQPRISLLKSEIAVSEKTKESIFKKYGSRLRQHSFKESSLFYDTGNGYHSEDRIPGNIKWFEDNRFEIYFSLNSITEPVCALRFDLTKEMPVKCQGLTFLLDKSELEFSPLYSVFQDNYDYFLASVSEYQAVFEPQILHGILKIRGKVIPLQLGEVQNVINNQLILNASLQSLPATEQDKPKLSQRVKKLFH